MFFFLYFLSFLFIFLSFSPSFALLQHTSLSPNGKLLLIVGDNPESMLVDSQNGKVVLTLLPFWSNNESIL